MEKVIDQVDNAEVFENDIQLYLTMFCEENDIESMKNESQSVWNSCLRYIYKHVFKGTDKLKHKDIILHDNTYVPSNYNMYDYNIVLDIVDIYIHDMCMKYNKEVSIIGFSKLTGINRDTIYDWGNNINKLSTKGCDVYKKLVEEREESLSSKLVTGKQNPVGVLGVLKRHYQWNMPGVSRETSKKQTLTAADLPQLGSKNIQIAQIPSDDAE